jgi:hypothetical protein
MAGVLARTGEAFEFWESPIHGLAHLNLRDRRSFALVSASVVGRVPVGTATIALTDDLPVLELHLVWRRENTSTTLATLLDTARDLAHREGWVEPRPGPRP